MESAKKQLHCRCSNGNRGCYRFNFI